MSKSSCTYNCNGLEHPPPLMMLTVTSQERLNMKLNCRHVLLYSAMTSGRITYM